MKTIPHALHFFLVGLSGFVFAAESPPAASAPKGLSSTDWTGIRAAYEAGRHEAHRQENGGLSARNPGQQWRTEFDGRGFTVTPDHSRWIWGLELTGYGDLTLPSGISSIGHEGGKITCQRNENLTEWFINDARGLEQGWTFKKKPVRQSSRLCLELLVRGDLSPQVAANGSSVSFQEKTGGCSLTYGCLKAWDADGSMLPVRFEQTGEGRIRIAIDDQNARYPVTIDPIAQQAYLEASNAPDMDGSDDEFGSSVAISGDTVIVGAKSEGGGTPGVNGKSDEGAHNSGAAYVFTRSGGAWRQQAYLKASNPEVYGYFGCSVAISGDTVVVGAIGEKSSCTGVNNDPLWWGWSSLPWAGAAYVFTRIGGEWSQQAYLKANNTAEDAMFGCSVAVSGDTVIVGAYGTGGIAAQFGTAYVFTRSGATWSQQASLQASNPQVVERVGYSVAISGNTVVAGAPGGTAGRVYVFTRIDGTWNQETYLEDIFPALNDGFGYSVAISGDTVVAGAPGGGGPGNAFIFTHNNGAWSQQAKLYASNKEYNDEFGKSVAISGDTVVIGAPYEASNATGVNGNQSNNTASYSGAAYVFTRISDTWSQQAYLKASNTEYLDNFGTSVAISGDAVIAGAPYERSSASGTNGSQADNSVGGSGAGYIFIRSGAWSQEAYVKAGNNGASDDGFGHSIAISGDTVVIGAPREDSNAIGVNGDQSDNSANNSGAAYVFIRNGGTWSLQAYLKASNTDEYDEFGVSVAISGDTVVVGAQKEDGSSTGVNGNQAENSAKNSGAAYVFTRSGAIWIQQAYFKASNASGTYIDWEGQDWEGDNFGCSVATSGDTVIVGALREKSNATGVNGNQTNHNLPDSGAAYVFIRNGGMWSQQAYLKASYRYCTYFGSSVAICGETVVVGAYGEEYKTGAAYVFIRNGASWGQQAYLKAGNADKSDRFGTSVAVSGDTVVVGAYGEASNAAGVNGNQADNSASYSGAAYVFARIGGEWSQQAYLKANNTAEDAMFGCSVAVSGDTVIVGAYGESSAGSRSGAAYLFARSGIAWSQQAYLQANITGSYDYFGYSVAVSGDTVAVGSIGGDSDIGIGLHQVHADNSLWGAGTATIFNGDVKIQTPEIAVEQAGANITDDTTKSFGSVKTGESASLSFVVRNIGTATLTGLSISKTGANAGEFTITADPATQVVPGGTSSFTIKFSPRTVGSKTAAIHIASSDADENPFDIALTGKAYVPAPEIVVEQPAGSNLVDGKSKKSFGTVEVGKTGSARSFTIKNVGAANLTGLKITTDGKHAKDFIVSAPERTTLAKGASTTFIVRFKPKDKGIRNATIHIKSNDADESPFDIKLSGMSAK